MEKRTCSKAMINIREAVFTYAVLEKNRPYNQRRSGRGGSFRFRSVFVFSFIACWANPGFAWTMPFNFSSRQLRVLPSAASSSHNTPTCGRNRGVLTRIQSSIQPEPEWWKNGDIHDLPYDSALLALTAYHRSNGDLVIPGSFIVPATNGENQERVLYYMSSLTLFQVNMRLSSVSCTLIICYCKNKWNMSTQSEYPVEWHGVKLSRYIYTMRWWQRHIAQHTDRVGQLNQLGFIWERLQPVSVFGINGNFPFSNCRY